MPEGVREPVPPSSDNPADSTWERQRRLVQEAAEQAARREALVQGELRRVTHELAALGAERVILFGSRARDDHEPWSDADLIVVMPSSLPFVERIVDVYRRVQPRITMDMLVYTPEEFAAGNPVIEQGLEEGKTLYERPGAPPT
jgi:predicted nucleotidyltransferase